MNTTNLRSRTYTHNSRIESAISKEFAKIVKKATSKHNEQRNPMLWASLVWNRASEQLRDILGNEIHNQWFAKITPLVISDNVLILEAPKDFDARWINQHYQRLVDVLLGFQHSGLSSFFVAPSDATNKKYRQNQKAKCFFRGVC